MRASLPQLVFVLSFVFQRSKVNLTTLDLLMEFIYLVHSLSAYVETHGQYSSLDIRSPLSQIYHVRNGLFKLGACVLLLADLKQNLMAWLSHQISFVSWPIAQTVDYV